MFIFISNEDYFNSYFGIQSFKYTGRQTKGGFQFFKGLAK